MNEPMPLQIRNAMLDMLRGITKANGYRTDIGNTIPSDGYPPPTGVAILDLSDFEESSDGKNGSDNRYRCSGEFTASADVPGVKTKDYAEAFNIQSDIKKAIKRYIPAPGLMIGKPIYNGGQVGKARDAKGVPLLTVDASFTVRYDDPAE